MGFPGVLVNQKATFLPGIGPEGIRKTCPPEAAKGGHLYSAIPRTFWLLAWGNRDKPEAGFAQIPEGVRKVEKPGSSGLMGTEGQRRVWLGPRGRGSCADS